MSVRSWVANEGGKHLVLMLWLGVNTWLFLKTFLLYSSGEQYYYLHKMLGSPIEYQRRESKSHSLGRNTTSPTVAVLQPRSSASMDHRQQPSLLSHTPPVPSWRRPQPSLAVSNPCGGSPQSAPPPVPCRQPPGPSADPRRGTSNGLSPSRQRHIQGVTAGVQATVLYDGVVVSGYRTKAMEL